MKMLALSLLLAGPLWQCKLQQIESREQSIRGADDALKVAVNYIGDTACMSYWKGRDDDRKGREVIAHNKSRSRQIATHMLNGPNGELISEEYRASAPHRRHLLLSGDRFFDKMRSKDSPLDMQTIADNCRRLVLSVDSDRPPTISFQKGFAISNQQELATMAHRTFGELECLDNQPFCSFECVADPNATCATNKRYFVLVWPDKETKQVKALVHWENHSKEDNSTITIPHLTYQSNPPAIWQRPSVTEPPTSEPPMPEPPTSEPEETTPPASASKVFTVAGLATVSIAEIRRITGTSDEAEVTLEFTALQNIRATLTGSVRVAIRSSNPFKFAQMPKAFFVPNEIHPSRRNFYSGVKSFEMRILDRSWDKGEKLVMKFIVKLHNNRAVFFKAKLSEPALFRKWKFFKDNMDDEWMIATIR